MAMYICEECDSWMDDDYNPMEDFQGKCVCPDCSVELEERGGDK